MSKRILIADDEPAVRQLLELVLRSQGYEVLPAQNGDQLVRTAQEMVPDLVLIDLMMPQMDGYEAIRQLRNDTRTAHLPMLILTAKSTADDVVIGFETGADDYITKPFNIPELLARVKAHLRRAAQTPVNNPLSGLPGNVLLTEELKYRLKSEGLFAVLYVDLDNFKAFNDTYGPARGDRLIKLVAEVLVEAVQRAGTPSDFIGHIGGDDFAVLTSPERLVELCQAIIELFDDRVRSLYDAEDLARGYLQATDRQGVLRHFPITSISIGVVTNRHRGFEDHEEVSRVAAEMKQYAKQQPGSTYAVDVRGTRAAPVARDRRGTPLPAVLLISADDSLRRQMQEVLADADYRTLEASGAVEAQAQLSYDPDPALIVADARLGDALWELCRQLRATDHDIPLVAVSSRRADAAAALQHGAAAFLPLPLDSQQLIDAAAQYARRDDPEP